MNVESIGQNLVVFSALRVFCWNRYKLIQTSLVVQPLYKNDSGVYSCQAKNQMGEAWLNVSLIVTGQLYSIQRHCDNNSYFRACRCELIDFRKRAAGELGSFFSVNLEFKKINFLTAWRGRYSIA